ncbi:hypothetical protein M885DRAFT_13944 [Pelagophyceae sp. CCMP2097]|nr:hypothetical protein M885DRAFT_13944 [Pelagophyceae sp. CCMP2097]
MRPLVGQGPKTVRRGLDGPVDVDGPMANEAPIGQTGRSSSSAETVRRRPRRRSDAALRRTALMTASTDQRGTAPRSGPLTLIGGPSTKAPRTVLLRLRRSESATRRFRHLAGRSSRETIRRRLSAPPVVPLRPRGPTGAFDDPTTAMKRPVDGQTRKEASSQASQALMVRLPRTSTPAAPISRTEAGPLRRRPRDFGRPLHGPTAWSDAAPVVWSPTTHGPLAWAQAALTRPWMRPRRGTPVEGPPSRVP